MALYKLEACRKSRWFLKPHATAISGHKILNGNLQSAQKCLHPKNTQTHSQSMQAHGQYLRHLFPLPTFLSLKHQFQVLGQFFTCPQKKKIEQHFSLLREVGHAFFITQTCVCESGRIRRGRKASLSVCARDVRESRACITSVSCNLFSSFLSFSFYLSPPA